MALIYRTQQLTEIWANSGHAIDIQNAVDQAKPGDSVFIPEGTFNFVNVDEPWMTVIIPAGINFFGAPTQRDAKNQVVTWKTILVMPYDVPGSDAWFKIIGSVPSSFSDIKLVGYREFDPTSKSMHMSVVIYGVPDFRVHHCYFRNTGVGVYIFTTTKNEICRGVIDHNRFINTVGNPGYGADYIVNQSIDYGIMPYRTSDSDYWDSDIMNVLGKYTDYSVYIEDNYFSRWRHCVASNNGMHYVFRHNIIEDDYGAASIDGHGTYTYVGTRAMEVYDNQILDPNYIYEGQPNVISWRGGGGVFFNNVMRDYYFTVYWRDEGSQFPQGYPGSADCPVYFWNNTYLHGGTHYDQPVQFESGSHEGSNVYINKGAMPNYTPYPYPHPLTLEEVPPPTTPWSGQLDEGIYRITMPAQVQVGTDIYNFKQWEDGSTDPVRTVNLTADMAITATYELVVLLTYNLTIAATTGGTTDPVPGVYTTNAGDIITVTATPADKDHKFKRFELDGEVKLQNPINVGMDADHTLLAVFETAAPPISPAIASLFILTLLGGVGALAVAKKGGE